MSRMDRTLQLELEPTGAGGTEQAEALGTITEAVEEMGSREGWSSVTVFRANLVLEELAVNAMTHGNTGAPGSLRIGIAIRPLGTSVEIEISDNGGAFNPLRDAPPPTDPLATGRAPEGGVGIHLVRNMTDEMHYRREDGLNLVTMLLEDRG